MVLLIFFTNFSPKMIITLTIVVLLSINKVLSTYQQSFYEAQSGIELTKSCSDASVKKYQASSITECAMSCGAELCDVYMKNGVCYCISRKCALNSQKVDESTGILYQGKVCLNFFSTFLYTNGIITVFCNSTEKYGPRALVKTKVKRVLFHFHLYHRPKIRLLTEFGHI